MRVILDHDVPHSLRRQFPEEHEVVTAHYQGWVNYDDDALLAAAEDAFDVLVTLDTNLVHQRNIRSYEIGIVVVDIHPVVPSHLERHIGRISSVLLVAASEQGTVVVREDEIVTPSL